jgi:hypothetical protein
VALAKDGVEGAQQIEGLREYGLRDAANERAAMLPDSASSREARGLLPG